MYTIDPTTFYQYIDDPAKLNQQTLFQLQQIVEAYPHFQVAKMLYLKNLAIVHDTHFTTELKKMSISLPDRRKLFWLIEGTRYGITLPKPTTNRKTSKTDEAFALIDAYLAEQPAETATAPQPSALFQPTATTDYLPWSLNHPAVEPAEESQPEEPVSPQPEVRMQYQELIDSFLDQDEHRSSIHLQPIEQEVKEEPSYLSLETDEKAMDDSYFTETLARIYVKQKRYEKALQIIKNLSLKFPEKNIYFADQIRFLEKLIINTKK